MTDIVIVEKDVDGRYKILKNEKEINRLQTKIEAMKKARKLAEDSENA